MTCARAAVLLVALLLHGCALLNQGRTDQDLQALQALHRSAQDAYGRGELDRAGEIYEKIISQSDVDAETWFVMGNIHARKGDHVRALSAYRKALDSHGAEARVWNNISVIHLKEAWHAAQLAHKHSAGAEPAYINSKKIIETLGGLPFLSSGSAP